jgi:uncharacterized membrane protein
MTNTTGLLFVHIIFAFLMFAGSFGALLLRYVAISHEDCPEKVALILGIVRPVVPIVVVALIVTVVLGLWLAHYQVGYRKPWLIATYCLIGYIFLVGGLAGREDRRTRELAEWIAKDTSFAGLVEERQRLKAKLRDPINWVLNSTIFAAIIVIIALMVFKP